LIDGNTQPVVHLKQGVLQAWVIDFKSTKKEIINLNPEVFGQTIRPDIVQRVVQYHWNKGRQGTHKGKRKSEVRGGGRKPHKQKGTGAARQGSIRSPHYKGGGAVFPPVPRSHATDLPIKVRNLGLKIALTAKYEEGNIHFLNDITLETHKTKVMDAMFFLWNPKNLIIYFSPEEFDPNFGLAVRHLEYVKIAPISQINVVDVLKYRVVLMTKNALATIEKELLKKRKQMQYVSPTLSLYPQVTGVNHHYIEKLKQMENNTRASVGVNTIQTNNSLNNPLTPIDYKQAVTIIRNVKNHSRPPPSIVKQLDTNDSNVKNNNVNNVNNVNTNVTAHVS